MNNEYFAYIRVSTAKQGDGASLEAQKDAIERYASQHGLSISKWFTEKETAAKRGRPQFNQLVKLLNAGKAAGVVIHKIDRSARNMRDWATVNELLDGGVDVRFAADSLDLTTRSGRLTAGMLAVMAEDYVRNLNEEREKGFNARLKQGLYPLKAPLGYLDNGGGKVKTICPERGPKIKELFELYATGQYSMDMLSDEMFERGLRSKHSGKIYKSKIDRILRDPFYIGMIKVWSTGYLGQGIHEPLISAHLFEQVQEVRQGRTNRKLTKHNLVFRRMIECSICNRMLIGERQRGHVYYRCHTKGCPTKTIREEAVQNALSATMQGMELSTEATDRLKKVIERSMSKNTPKKPTEPLEIQKARLRDQKDRLADAYVSGLIDKETLQAKQEDLLVLETQLSQNARETRSADEIRAHVAKILEHLKSLVATYLLANVAEKRQFLDLVFSNISLTDRNSLFQTKTWLDEATNLQVVPYCGRSEDTHRRLPDLGSSEIQEFIDTLNCPEARDFCRLCDEIDKRNKVGDLPEVESKTDFPKAA